MKPLTTENQLFAPLCATGGRRIEPLRGVTRQVKLDIDDFKCIDHPMLKREVCGADVSTKFNRKDFGLTFGLDMGFKPEVELEIQVEAARRP